MRNTFIRTPDVPLGHTPMGDMDSLPLGFLPQFWDIPKLADTLLGPKRLLNRGKGVK